MKPKKAFTLVEVILAVALLGVVVVVYLNGIGQGFLLMRSGVDYTISTFDAQKEMEELVVESKSNFEASPENKDFTVNVFSGANEVTVDLKTVVTTNTKNPIYTAFVTSYKLPEALAPSVAKFDVGVYTQGTMTPAFPWFEDPIELRGECSFSAVPVIYQNRNRWYISNDAEAEPAFPSGYLVYFEELKDMPGVLASGKTLVKNSALEPLEAAHFYYFESRPFTAEGKIATFINEDRILVLNRNGSALWQSFIEDVYFNRENILKTDTDVDVMQNTDWPTLDLGWKETEDPEGAMVATRIPASLRGKSIKADVNFEIDKKALAEYNSLLGTGISFVNAENSGYMFTFDVIENKVMLNKLNKGRYDGTTPLKEIDLLTDPAFEKLRTTVDGVKTFYWTKSLNSTLSYRPASSSMDFQLHFLNEAGEIVSSDIVSVDLGTSPITPEFIGFKSYSELPYKPDSRYEITDKYQRNYAAHFYNLSLTQASAEPEEDEIVNLILNNNIFVYGSDLYFKGNEIIGNESAIFISNKEGALENSNFNYGAKINVSNIYVQGRINTNNGSVLWGSEEFPGQIHVDNDVNFGSGDRHIYGDMYINGDFRIGHAIIHGKVYVDGDFGLGEDIGRNYFDFLSMEGHVYYTGKLIEFPKKAFSTAHPDFPATKVTYVPPVVIPKLTMPTYQEDKWYQDRGYITDKNTILSDDLKLFVDGYSGSSDSSKLAPKNVIIVAKTGDIEIINMWKDDAMTGILFAPNGKVTFSGGRFEGLVIAKNGFFVPSGGSYVKFLPAIDFTTKINMPFRAPVK
ncbi:prepilin-type N-terminal cleavage/methylation domain-containing protein [Fusibacter sp. 3D3]|uniref:prepilin-type N-terminal cleavage/methylation domain-containing protein n=1 Tax=Fusibacter sp. 3D3 TaxID=1048380 RepID=UPI000852BF5E|nr:prepilin-type N-terminal cleavage/methylation domain-containing protein [Fusibacter sp. 3D3]GAU79403.1 hypothetical protein F3D3_4064 [Fusibacter sp. 3D3]